MTKTEHQKGPYRHPGFLHTKDWLVYGCCPIKSVSKLPRVWEKKMVEFTPNCMIQISKACRLVKLLLLRNQNDLTGLSIWSRNWNKMDPELLSTNNLKSTGQIHLVRGQLIQATIKRGDGRIDILVWDSPVNLHCMLGKNTKRNSEILPPPLVSRPQFSSVSIATHHGPTGSGCYLTTQPTQKRSRRREAKKDRL